MLTADGFVIVKRPCRWTQDGPGEVDPTCKESRPERTRLDLTATSQLSTHQCSRNQPLTHLLPTAHRRPHFPRSHLGHTPLPHLDKPCQPCADLPGQLQDPKQPTRYNGTMARFLIYSSAQWLPTLTARVYRAHSHRAPC